jgi:asparagine synthase (glutamine-hydrolysing)
MCGIAGFVSFGDSRDARWLTRLGERMATVLRHRGPDDSGVYVSPDRTVMLAGVRLAVRDLSSAGHQPMQSPDGLVTLVYNGELYRNRGRAPAGWPRRSHCDTEEFLQVVHQSADDIGSSLAALDSMFAAAWHDQRTGRVVLARDHFGIKPLVWALVDGGLVFASEAPALFATGLVHPAVDPLEFIHHAYVRMDSADDRTWFNGVFAVEPAHLLVIEGANVREHRYWSPNVDERPVDVEELTDAFHQAVAIRRPADVPMATVVSGGVDSSAIFAALSELGCDTAPYVVRYQGGGESQNEDLPYAMEVSRSQGREPTVCDIRVDDLTALTENVVRHVHRPFLHGAELALYRTYQHIAADGRVVVFSGHGADEMWGYQDGRYFPIVDPRRPPDTHSEYYLRNRLYREERPAWHRMLDRMSERLGVKEHEVAELVWNRTFAPYRDLDTLDPIKRGRYQLMRRFMVYVNGMVDGCSAAFALEDRPVFQDARLADLAFGMPEYVKNREGLTDVKPFLKAALGGLLPANVVARPKKGFPEPDDPRFRAELSSLIHRDGLPFDLELTDAELDGFGIGELLFLYSTRVWLRQLDEWTTRPIA